MKKPKTAKPEDQHVFILDELIKNYNAANPDKRQMTQRTLADDLGVTEGWLSSIKPSRKGVPSWVAVACKMCEIFGVELKDIFPKQN